MRNSQAWPPSQPLCYLKLLFFWGFFFLGGGGEGKGNFPAT